ncbi:MAG TPA: ABC transporter substrate-binding protein [Candidatus Lustribacter sp.]
MTVHLTRRAALVAASCVLAGTATARAQNAAPDLVALRLASSPADDTMPVLYAQQTGAFRRAGLDVHLTRATSGSAVAAGVAGGSVDVGKSSVVSIVTARAKGVPFVWIAPASVYNPASPDGGLIVAANSAIKTARDLNGKIVAVPALGDLNSIATRAWADQNGGDSKSIQFVEVPVAAQAAALDEGRIAAAGIINPFLGEAMHSGKARFLAPFYSAIANKFMLSGWFTLADFAARHRDAVAAFQRIIDSASTFTNAHHLETAPLLVSWSGITLDQATHFPRMTNGTRIAADDIQPVIDLLAKYGVIPKAFDAREMIVEPPR